MLPTDFPERNKIYKKPESMTDEECMELPVWQGQTFIDDEKKKSVHIIISCWKLSYEDLQEIQRTGHIWLSIYSSGMPVVSLFTEHPFKKD